MFFKSTQERAMYLLALFNNKGWQNPEIIELHKPIMERHNSFMDLRICLL